MESATKNEPKFKIGDRVKLTNGQIGIVRKLLHPDWLYVIQLTGRERGGSDFAHVNESWVELRDAKSRGGRKQLEKTAQEGESRG
jgi:hypothetical protein